MRLSAERFARNSRNCRPVSSLSSLFRLLLAPKSLPGKPSPPCARMTAKCYGGDITRANANCLRSRKMESAACGSLPYGKHCKGFPGGVEAGLERYNITLSKGALPKKSVFRFSNQANACAQGYRWQHGLVFRLSVGPYRRVNILFMRDDDLHKQSLMPKFPRINWCL